MSELDQDEIRALYERTYGAAVAGFYAELPALMVKHGVEAVALAVVDADGRVSMTAMADGAGLSTVDGEDPPITRLLTAMQRAADGIWHRAHLGPLQ